MDIHSKDQVLSIKFKYRPLYPGFDWNVVMRVIAAPSLFPVGVKLRAQVRTEPGAAVLGVLTTDAGHLVRVDNDRIQITIPGSLSAKWAEGTVMFDLVRTDLTPAVHLGLRVKVETKTSLTGR